MKARRQAEILTIIRDNDIETQDQLLEKLREKGMKSTQATISRDIKELHLVKELTGRGAYKYAVSQKNTSLNVAGRLNTIFRESDFARYIDAFESDTSHDGMWAVTPFVDDEKPLWVTVDDKSDITAFLDANPDGRAHLVSGGVYAMTHRALPVLHACLEEGVSRMRNFQRKLIAAGLRLQAYSIDKIIDVDHAGDIATAEEFIKTDNR